MFSDPATKKPFEGLPRSSVGRPLSLGSGLQRGASFSGRAHVEHASLKGNQPDCPPPPGPPGLRTRAGRGAARKALRAETAVRS